jgi:hypothetical protein
MAALDREDYAGIGDALAEALNRSITSRTNDEEKIRRKQATDELLKFSNELKKTTASQKLFKSVLTGTAQTYEDVTDKLEKLDEAISAASDAHDLVTRDQLLQQKALVKNTAAWHNAQVALGNFTLGAIKSTVQMGQAFAGGTGQFVRGLQSGASSVDLAAGAMSAAVDVAGAGMSATSAAVTGFGSILQNSTNPKFKMFGYLAQGAGIALSFFGQEASKLAKFGIEVLSAEVKKSVDAFQQTNTAGALFVDGVQGMRDASLAAGLTVNQFAKVVQENSSTLAGSGLGVSGGIKKVGAALKAGGDTMQRSLLNLGYSLEDQAGLVAETMKDMRQSGGPLKATDTQIAAETQKYAENLRIISAITGEDAKQRMARVRDQASQLGFQQKLAGMDETQRKGVINAMGNMSELERKNFMDMVMFGSVINKEGAAAAAMSQGLTDSVTSSYKAFQAGKLDDAEQRRINGQYTGQIKDDMLRQSDIGMAGMAGIGGFVTDLSKVMGDELKFRNAWTADAQKLAEQGTKGQETTKDKLTNDLMKALQASQKMALDLQSAMDPLIAGYSKVTEKMLEEISKTFSDIADQIAKIKPGEASAKSESVMDKTLRVAGAAATGAATGALIGEPAGAVAGTFAVPGVGTVAGGIVGGVAGGVLGGLIGGITEFFSSPKNTRLDGTGKHYGAAVEPSTRVLLVHAGERVLNPKETAEYNAGLIATPTVAVQTATQTQAPMKEFFDSLSTTSSIMQNSILGAANKLSDVLAKDINVKVESTMPPGLADLFPQFSDMLNGFGSDIQAIITNTAGQKLDFDPTAIKSLFTQMSDASNTAISNLFASAKAEQDRTTNNISQQVQRAMDQTLSIGPAIDKTTNNISQQVQRAMDQTLSIGPAIDKTTAAQMASNREFTDTINSNLKSIATANSVSPANSELSDSYTRLLNAIAENNKIQVAQAPKEVKTEQPTQPINMDQSKLIELMSKQLESMQEHMIKTDNLISLMSENKDYTRSLLQNSY